MEFVSRAQWGARPPRYTNPLNFNVVNKFILHYSGASRTQTVRSIQNYSMDTKGYSDIDYNYLIKDGLIYVGRGDNIGGHTLNNNSSSIGVCIIGNDGDATDADFRAARQLYDHMVGRIGHSLAKTTHRMVLGAGYTSCPGSEIENWVKAGMPYPGGTSSEDEMEVIKKIQEGLRDAGFDPGPIDGEWGPRTMAAFVTAMRAVGPKGDKGDPGVKGDKGDPGELVGRELIMTARITHA
jgi:hypothetical protein